uniref:Signal peptide-containing protein n=1 Tax=Strongyloides venezuelensis TaxID=75913 RepID=A0A0K0FN64_STRVS
MDYFIVYWFLILGLIQLKCSFVNCVEYDIYIKGYIGHEINSSIECSECKVLISLINTNSESDVIYKKLSKYVLLKVEDGRNRQYFELFKRINDTNPDIDLSFFKFVDIKKFFNEYRHYISFLHVSINTKFKNKKKRYQSIVYPNGDKTPNSISLFDDEPTYNTNSTLFYLNKIQTVKIHYYDRPNISKYTFMNNKVLYQFVDSLVYKRRLIPNMINLKKEAKKYDKYIKANQVLTKRFNFWVEFVNFFRSKFSSSSQSSVSPFY